MADPQRATEDPAERYIPALRYDWATPLYDPFQRWIFRESHFKRQLIEQADIQSGHRVLDVGCGTATLTLMIRRAHPDAEVVGLDGDPRVLAIARRKAERAGLDLALHQAMSFDLPFPDASFDRVVSSLMFHHLTRENKQRTLSETFRVLRAGGEIHVVDFGELRSRFGQWVAARWHRGEEMSDNLSGRLPELFREAGFEVEEVGHRNRLVGPLSFYRGRKSRPSPMAP